jgi:hypothetical protein
MFDHDHDVDAHILSDHRFYGRVKKVLLFLVPSVLVIVCVLYVAVLQQQKVPPSSPHEEVVSTPVVIPDLDAYLYVTGTESEDANGHRNIYVIDLKDANHHTSRVTDGSLSYDFNSPDHDHMVFFGKVADQVDVHKTGIEAPQWIDLVDHKKSGVFSVPNGFSKRHLTVQGQSDYIAYDQLPTATAKASVLSDHEVVAFNTANGEAVKIPHMVSPALLGTSSLLLLGVGGIYGYELSSSSSLTLLEPVDGVNHSSKLYVSPDYKRVLVLGGASTTLYTLNTVSPWSVESMTTLPRSYSSAAFSLDNNAVYLSYPSTSSTDVLIEKWSLASDVYMDSTFTLTGLRPDTLQLDSVLDYLVTKR